MNETHFAAVIRDYWAARGYVVDCAPRDCPIKGQAGVHYVFVRSNLIGGLPPGYQDMTINTLAVTR